MLEATATAESRRLKALLSLDVLDTPQEEKFDQIVHIAKLLVRAPVAAFGLMDARRQWFKSLSGIAIREVPLAHSFCSHMLRSDATMVVPNALEDSRFSANPLVIGEPRIRFYVGAPVRVDGLIVGTLVCIDTAPREIARSEVQVLEFFGDLLAGLMMQSRKDRIAKEFGSVPQRGNTSGRMALNDAHLAVQRNTESALEALARVGAAYSDCGELCAAVLAQFLESKLRQGHNFSPNELRALSTSLECFEYLIEPPVDAPAPLSPRPPRIRLEYTRISPECTD
jgi:GAF domain-containing protein